MQKVIVLKPVGGGPGIAGTEYNPDDYGRLHLLGESRYAQFDRERMVLEYQKTAIDIEEIVYEAESWPKGLAPTRFQVLEYFGMLP